MKVHGRCHCGELVYEAEVDPAQASICHCLDCQILTGTAYRVSVPAKAEHFRILSGVPKIYVKTAESGNPRAQAFFDRVRTHTMEGMFSDPIYGGNRDKAGWKLIGFPGVIAVHRDNVEKYRGKKYTADALGIADLS